MTIKWEYKKVRGKSSHFFSAKIAIFANFIQISCDGCPMIWYGNVKEK